MDTRYYEKRMKRLYPDKYKDKCFDEKTMSWRKKKGRKGSAYKRWGLSSKEYAQLRNRILDRDDNGCQECGSDDNLHVHHIFERHNGGTNNEDNLITLCAKCHAEKHKDLSVYNLMVKAI
jgi:5-methylcytosine-specific restriction endonuclease McrA